MKMVTKTATMAAVFASLIVPASYGASTFTDFEAAGFTPGQSVDNHLVDGTEATPRVDYTDWSPPAWAAIGSRRLGYTADEEIVDLGGVHGKVWRYSQNGVDGRLGQTPKSPHGGFVAGESTSTNDAGMGAATTNRFYGQVDFRSVAAVPEPGMAVRIMAASADRSHGYLMVSDVGVGLQVDFWRADLSAYESIATGLSYAAWYTLGIDITFLDGPANDIVDIWLDSVKIYTGPSWESLYGIAQSVDRLSFDVYADVGNHPGGGMYFDNVLLNDIGVQQQQILEVAHAPVPAAAWAGMMLIGALGGIRGLRRKLRRA
jgi:hypothetical protein